MLIEDAFLIIFAASLTFFFRFGRMPFDYIGQYMTIIIVFTAVRLICLHRFGLYNRIWEYASISELITTIKAVTCGTVINTILVYFVFRISLDTLSMILLCWLLNITLIGGSRLLTRIVQDRSIYLQKYSTKQHGKRVLIIGAGDGGALTAKEIINHYHGQVNIVGFIDDDPMKQNFKLLNLNVLGSRQDIPQIINRYRIEEVVIAMPSVGGKTIREIVEICQKTDVSVKILPGVFDIIEGNVTVNQIRKVQVEDLLGREPVRVDLQSMANYIQDRVVLVTGAGGSIGSELCRQLAKLNPHTLLLLDMCENNVYDIEMDLKLVDDIKVVPLVKDVRDQTAINRIFKIYGPEVVFHAAAHKHVPLMETNSEEAIKNNCRGTYIVAQAANTHGAERFVLVSTDKAVNPTSVMGASKRIAEMIIQHLNTISDTSFVGVRFGNVLGSRGSVVPLFQKQIAKGGPITITHKDMVRYFMTIPEAVQLIIQAGAFAKGGEIFVLDMGEPVSIMHLAETILKLSGFKLDEIEIKETGMRPGEKLYEELLTPEEVRGNRTSHERIFIAPPNEVNGQLLSKVYQEFMIGKLPNGLLETEKWIQRFLPEFTVDSRERRQVVSISQSQRETAVSRDVSLEKTADSKD